MTLTEDPSYKSNASNKYRPFVTIREAGALRGSERVGLALVLHSFSDGGSEATLHGLRFARGFAAQIECNLARKRQKMR
jgi:hypothetical protein